MAERLADCHFCSRYPGVFFALTRCRGDPKITQSWKRLTLAVCARCQRLLGKAGREGLVEKKTKDRWWLGHTVGQPPSPKPRLS